MKKVDKKQEHFNGKSPAFVLPSGIAVKARFLEVMPEALGFPTTNFINEELVSTVAEQLVEHLILNGSKTLLDADNSFTQQFELSIQGNTLTTVGVFSLFEEGFYYCLRLDKIM
jgi:hypothetical protein